MTTLRIVLATLVLALCASRSFAQWAVFDAANFQENLLNEFNTASQVTNQITQLAHEVSMLQNQAQHLKNLNFTTLPQLLSTLSTTVNLINQTQRMAFNLTQTQQTLAATYPSSYGTSVSFSQLNADSLSRWQTSHDALSTALQVQSQASQNFAADQALSSLMTRSSGSVGALQGMQATNELLGLVTRQLIQSQQIALTQGRADSLELARTVEADARARQVRQRFMTTTPYTPQPVDF
ncbi:MAG TPA: P-type conjugative transfer protein TrbJ [Steroidobacteraceae bacterium]